MERARKGFYVEGRMRRLKKDVSQRGLRKFGVRSLRKKEEKGKEKK